MKREVELCLRDRDADGAIVVLNVGYSDAEIEALLKKHPNWYRSSFEM